MLMILAVLLAAEVEPGNEASVTAGIGLHGERKAELAARTSSATFTLEIGASRATGPLAPERDELRLALKKPAWHAELKGVPGGAGLWRAGLEAGVQFEPIGFILDLRAAEIGPRSMRGAGLRAELEGELLEDLHGGLGVGVWLLDLRTPATAANAWALWGQTTLDWAQKAAVEGWLSRELGPLSLTPGLALCAPASGGAEARGSLAVEIPLGPLRLKAGGGLGHRFPTGESYGEVEAGLTLSLQ